MAKILLIRSFKIKLLKKNIFLTSALNQKKILNQVFMLLKGIFLIKKCFLSEKKNPIQMD